MNKIQSAIKCPKCSKVLSTPIILPCGHSICQEHTGVEQKQIVCEKCGRSHENIEFPINEQLMEIIDAEVASINFGVVHEDATQSFNLLDEALTRFETILNDPIYFVHESVTDLKSKINLKTEELKLLIDETSQRLLNELDEYEKQCTENIETSRPESGLDEFKKLRDETRAKMRSWSNFLNQLKYDEDKYKQIKTECDQCQNVLGAKFEVFKQAITMNKLPVKKACTDYFCETNIKLKTRAIDFQIDSLILDDDLKEKLSILLNYNREIKVQLLYRGTQDGFAACTFHQHCDNQLGTITLVKTAGGYIFGGYTLENLGSYNVYNYNYGYTSATTSQTDPIAFIFSLVNKYNYPIRMNVKENCNSVTQNASLGPTFGDKDFIICNNSDTCAESSSFVGNNYQLPEGYFSVGESLAESQNFFVEELEIFKID